MITIGIAPPADTVIVRARHAPGATAQVTEQAALLLGTRLAKLGEGLDALAETCRRAATDPDGQDPRLQSVEWIVRTLSGTLDELRGEVRRLAG